MEARRTARSMMRWRWPLVLAVAQLLIAAVTAAATCPPNHGSPTLQVQQVESGVVNVVYAAGNNQVVFAITEMGRVWRSTNAGATWADDTPRLAINGQPPPSWLVPVAIDVQVHPADVNRILIRGGQETHWASADAGATYRAIVTPGVTAGDNFRMHATRPDWLLISITRDSCWPAWSVNCANDLFVSQDFGATWANLTANGAIAGFVSFDWAFNKVRNSAGAAVVETTILATAYHDVGQRAAARGWNRAVNFVRSDDWFASQRTLVECGNAFDVIADRIFLAGLSNCHDASAPPNVHLYTSDDGGASFARSCFPVDVAQRGYMIVDALEGSALVCVDADTRDDAERAASVTNLYASDAGFSLFSLSMRRVAANRGSSVDVMRIHGIDGIFMANHLSANSLRDPAVASGKRPYSDYYMTKVTFSKGGRWENLTLPTTDALGNPVVCTDAYCLLHLHGPSSWFQGGSRPSFAAFYSHSAAPGVIMGTGNIGQYLSFDPTRVNTYLSRDGGETWDEIRKGPYIYEYGDHGGLLVMSKYASSGFTDEMLYSLDLGVCWEGPLKFSQPMAVDNIRVDPTGSSHTFIAHGRLARAEYGRQLGAIVTADFKTMALSPAIRDCSPTSDDYELWGIDHCILGAKIRMQRRKREARCFNGLSFNRSVDSAVCDCTLPTDMECEFGCERPGPGIPCAPIPGYDPHATCPSVTYLSKSHYRLVSTDVCYDRFGIVDRGPGGGPGGMRRHGVMSPAGVACLVLGLLAASLLACVVASRAACCRDRMPPVVLAVPDALAGCAAGLGGCLTAAWERAVAPGGYAGYKAAGVSLEDLSMEPADRYSPPLLVPGSDK